MKATYFRVFFDEAMLRNIRKRTVAEAHRFSEEKKWNVTLDELDKFIGQIIARRILGHICLRLESLWDTTCVCKVFKKLLIKLHIQGNNAFPTFRHEERKAIKGDT